MYGPGTKLYPRHVAEQLLRTARDEARRGDVRQIAYLLACRSIDVGEPPYIPDLAQVAVEVAERYVTSGGINRSEFEALHYLEPEPAALLVTALFERCLPWTLEQQGYMAGNEVVGVVAALGRSFVPDIPALFEFYQETYRRAFLARMEWYKAPDDRIVFFSDGGGSLAVGWQIAWTVARAGLLDMIAGLARSSIQARRRNGWRTCVAGRCHPLYVARPSPIRRVSEPATDAAVVVQGVRSTWSQSAMPTLRSCECFTGPTGSRRLPRVRVNTTVLAKEI